MRIKIFNEMAVSSDNSLNFGPKPLVGLGHGVPVKGAHQRLHVLDQVLDSIVKFCIDLLLRNAPHKIVQKAVVRWAGRPNLIVPHLLEPVLHPLACLRTWLSSPNDKGFVPEVLGHRISYFICYRNVHLPHQGPNGPAVVPGDELLQAGQYTCGAKPGDYDSSRSFLLIYLCRNVSVFLCFSFYKALRQLSAKLLVNKLIF